MAVVLKLQDNIGGTIDFTLNTGVFQFLRDGLDIGFPEVIRIMGGDALQREGNRLVERKYGSREIKIRFKMIAADHDTLVTNIRTLDRMLDRARKIAKDVVGDRVELHYKLDNATDEVVFDVIDGEFRTPDFASPTLRRNADLLDCELTLICAPFARAASTYTLKNYLRNPSFEWNPGELGRDGGYYIDLGAAGTRLSQASPVGLQSTGAPPVMSGGIWVRWDAVTGEQRIITCGFATVAWRLYKNTSHQIVFDWWDTANAIRTVTSNTVVTTGVWYHIAFTIFSTIGTDAVTVMVINGDHDGGPVRTTSALAMRTASGVFAIGADPDDTDRLDARVCGAWVITGKQLLPYQLAYIYRWGQRGLIKQSSPETGFASPITPEYWGFSAADFGGCWYFDENTTPVLDSAANRDLTIVGSPTITKNMRKPGYWTLGSTFSSSTISGLVSSSAKAIGGNFGVLFNEAGAANLYIEQVITTPANQSTHTLVLWLKSIGSNKQIKVEYGQSGGVTQTDTITLSAAGVYQFVKEIVATSPALIRILWDSGAAQNVTVLGAAMYDSRPFGEIPTWTDSTSNPKPWVGCKDIRSYPDASRVPWLDIASIPGDAPAGVRVYVKNPDAGAKAPIKVGCANGRDVWRQQLAWRAALFVPDYTNGSFYTSAAPNQIDHQAGTTLLDRAFLSLARLFPFPSKQYGSFKAYLGISSGLNVATFLRSKTLQVTMPLTNDPQKNPNATSIPTTHLVDGGILSWPPEVGLADFRNDKMTSHPRDKVDSYTPKLVISTIADAAISSLDFRFMYLLPIDGGFFSLVFRNQGAEGIKQNELLVIDTIEQNASAVGYLAKEVTIANESSGTPDLGELGIFRMPSGADLSLFGTGFSFDPGTQNYLMFTQAASEGSFLSIFGAYTETALLDVAVEIEPRYLYV